MLTQLLGLALQIIFLILNMLIVVIIVQVVISWLFAFEIVNRRTPVIDTIWRFTGVITEPLLRPIRRIIPPVSGFDFSPMVLLLIIYVIQRLIPMLL